jgi:uncharacterized protein YajQ (UPF0234 family)
VHFKSIIIHDIDREYQHQYSVKHTNAGYDDKKDIKAIIDNNRNTITLVSDDNSDLQKIERMIKDILIKQKIDDYVVIQDAEEVDKIVILKREHGEQLGIYHCRHCAMAFEDKFN